MSSIRVVLCGEIVPGVQTRNVFTYDRAVGILTGDSKAAFAVRFIAMFAPIVQFISGIWRSDRIEFSEWDGEEWQPRGTVGCAIQGDSVVEMMPTQVAALVSGFTERKGVRAKKFLAGLTEAAFIDGVPLAGLASVLASFVTYWVAPVTVAGEQSWYAGCWSNLLSLFTPIVSGDVSSYASSQRRRKPGVGV